MIKIIPISILFILSAIVSQAQLSIESGTQLFISSQNSISFDGLTLTPADSYSLSGPLVLNTYSTSGQTTVNNSIQRVFRFNTVLPPFSGNIIINYNDGELNGIPESMLQLNVYKENSWQNFTASQSDQTQNYLTTNIPDPIPITELTLASSNAALPLENIDLTAIKNGDHIMLKARCTGTFSTSTTYSILYRNDHLAWRTISESSLLSDLITFTHTNPVEGNNYYQVKISEPGSTAQLSRIIKIQFGTAKDFSIIKNPVTNGKIQLNIGTAQLLQFINSEGRIITKKYFNKGIHELNLSLKKGQYFIKGTNQTRTLIIQ